MKLKIIFIYLLFCFYAFPQDYLDSFKTGLKITLPFAEVCGNLKTKSFSNFPESYNYGLSIFTDRFTKNFPCCIKYGKLNISGAYSKLNSPLLSSSISPFSKSSTTVTYLTSSLPGSNSFSNNDSVYLKLGYKKNKNHISTSNISAVYIPNINSALLSSEIDFTYSKLIKSFHSITAAYFPYQENIFNSWFSTTEKYYHAGNHFCINLQNALQTSIFKSLISYNIYESPMGNFNHIIKTENLLSLQNYNFSFSALLNRNLNITTCTKETNDPCIQLKTGFNKKILIGTIKPIFLKTGFATYSKIDLLESDNQFKFSTGFTITCPFTTFTINGGATTKPVISKNSATLNFSSMTFQFSNCWNLQKIIPTFKSNFTYTRNTGHLSQSHSLNLCFLKNPKISIQNSLSIDTYKEKSCTFKETSSVKINFSTKYITCFCYLSMIFFADS